MHRRLTRRHVLAGFAGTAAAASAWRPALAETAGETETVALLARARGDLEKRLTDARQELETLAAVQE